MQGRTHGQGPEPQGTDARIAGNEGEDVFDLEAAAGERAVAQAAETPRGADQHAAGAERLQRRPRAACTRRGPCRVAGVQGQGAATDRLPRHAHLIAERLEQDTTCSQRITVENAGDAAREQGQRAA